jgi:hypothetical protein
MSSSFGFHCRTCGEYHEDMPSFGWEHPMEYERIAEEERPARADLTSDMCIIDDQWFLVRGCIEIPVHGQTDPFVYGVWVSLSEKSFQIYYDTYQAEGREREGPFFGWLTAVPLPYPNELLKTRVHLRPLPTRPYIELEATDHPLAVDQRNGISTTRLQEIVERLLHEE